jgi:hypothetical protein
MLDGELASQDRRACSQAAPKETRVVGGEVNVDRSANNSDQGAGNRPAQSDQHVSRDFVDHLQRFSSSVQVHRSSHSALSRNVSSLQAGQSVA